MIYAGLLRVDVVGHGLSEAVKRLIINRAKLDEALLRLLTSFVRNIRLLAFVQNEEKLGWPEYDSDMFYVLYP
jgi:hypothetical protein